MSSESIAMLRKNAGEEMAKLAEDHLNHDLQASDRDALNNAARKLSTYTSVGSVLGLGLGLAAAFRVRSLRTKAFAAFRAAEKPTHVRFADGREEAIPDVTALLQPSKLGDVAAMFFFGLGGLFIGGETGLLAGSVGAKNSITKDPESMKRIETAFRRFKVDILKNQVKDLESKDNSGPLGMW